MGGCLGLQNKNVLIDYKKINIDILINKWEDQQFHTIKDKFKQFEHLNKDKKMKLEVFLNFFPLLKTYCQKGIQKKIFNLFDYDKDQLVSSKQIIYGMSMILKTEVKQVIEILFKMYKNPNRQFMNQEQFQNFINQNKSFLDETNINTILSENNQQVLLLPEFYKLIQKYYDIKKFRSIFQIATNQKEANLINQIKKANYQIALQPNDKVYLISFRWFDSWKRYAEKKYDLECNIEFASNIKKSMRNKKINSQLNSAIKSFYQDQKLYRPQKIQNRFMEGEYKNQLKVKLEYFKDYLAIPQNMWKILLQLYDGGPQFPRIYPQFHPLTINKAYVNSKGRFIQQKLDKYTIHLKDTMQVIFPESERVNKLFYKKNLQQQNWSKIIIGNNPISDYEILNQCFICAIDSSCEQNFLSEYNLNQKNQYKNLKNYGLKIRVKIYTNYVEAYIMQIYDNKVKIHFKDKPYQSDKIVTYNYLQKVVNNVAYSQPTKSNICAGLYNLGNTCYMNSVLQCLFYTPIFGQLLTQEKYKEQINQQKSNMLIIQLSKLAIQMQQCTESLRPFKLRKQISKQIPRFANNEQQDAQQFLCQFLNKISEQLSKKKINIDKLQKLDFEISDNNKIERYSIIEKFFSGSQCSRIICSQCFNKIERKENFFALNLTVPEIQDIFYSAIFIPFKNKNSKQFNYMKKLTIKIKKTVTFQEYAQQFSKILKIPIKNLIFVEYTYQQTEFKRIFHQEDYKNLLFDLGLRNSDNIYIFDKTIEIGNRLSKSTKLINKSFPNNLRTNELIDILDFNQYKPARFIQFIDQQNYQFRYETQGMIQTLKTPYLFPFLSKCKQKDGYPIQIKHRKRINKYKNEIFGLPFLIYIYNWMTWGEIIQIIKRLSQYYIDPDHRKKIKQEQYQKQLEKQSQNDKQKYKKQLSLKSQDDRQQLFNKESRYIKSNQQYEIKSPLFHIRLHDGNYFRCWSCHKNTLVEPELEKQQKEQQNLCKGCKIDQNIPLTILINLKRIVITLDWAEPRAYQNETFKFIQDDSTKQRQIQQNLMRNTIDECFKLYTAEEQKVELKCQKCENQYSSIRTFVSKPPNILIVHFKRFKFIKGFLQKMNNKISLSLEINLKQINMNYEDSVYQLYAINCHKGSGLGGHYYCYILKDEKSWIKCDDEYTEASQLSNIDLSQIYLLFYRKINMQASVVSLLI